MPTIEISVSTGLDDGYSEDGTFSNTASTVQVGRLGTNEILDLFARFQNVSIEQGATIDVAYLTVNVFATGVAGVVSNIYFNDINDAVAPTSTAEHAALSRTTEFTVDTTEYIQDDTTNTPSIVSVVQEIVDRTGWVSGNDMMVLWDDDSSTTGSQYFFHSFEGSGNDIILHVEYTARATDPSEMVRTLLSDDWDTANTNSHQPLFVTSVDPEVLSSRNQDVIKVYESRPRVKRKIDLRYDYATYIAAVTIQVDIGHTPSGITLPEHSALVLEEVERIIQAGRFNPDGYWDLLETDSFIFQHQYRNFARNNMNVNCKRIVQRIPGT